MHIFIQCIFNNPLQPNFIMKNLTLSLLVMALTVWACNKQQSLEVISRTSHFEKFYLTADTVRVKLTDNQKFIYPKLGALTHKDSLYIVGYNDHLHALDIFNLDAQKYIKRIILERDGPNGIAEVIGFTPISLDSIYILSTYRVALIDGKGNIKNKISINNPSSPIKGHDSEEYMFWLETGQSLYFDRARHSLYALNHSYQHGQCDPKRYQDASLVAQLNLAKKRMTTLPVGYPFDKVNNCYGFITRMFTEWSENELIYNFQYDPNVYVMDRQTQMIKAYDGSSEYTKNEVTPISWGECEDVSRKLDHFTREVNFGKVLKDSHNGLHYRFHRKELRIDNPSGNSINDKKLFLTVFDNNYAKVGEMILDNRAYPDHVSFVGKKGLYVAAPEGNEDTLVFYIFDVHTIPKGKESLSALLKH